MRTLEEYVAMIPTAPPDDIERYLDALGRKPLAITSYRCISRDDAESRLDCEDCRADLRPQCCHTPCRPVVQRVRKLVSGGICTGLWHALQGKHDIPEQQRRADCEHRQRYY